MNKSNAQTDRAFLTKYAWLSIAAALITISLKSIAYILTDSVGLFSDAIESLINLAVAILALAVLIIAARPADEEHAYGHNKAEYFSSGAEGSLILIAALSIAYAGFQRLFSPQPLEQINLGLALSLVASLINLIVALVLLRASKRHESVTLEANAQHLLADVWTSVGIVLGVAAVAYTGWQFLDPLIAFAVALNITVTGAKIVKNSTLGLMDTALPEEDINKVKKILERYTKDDVRYHALRTRRSGVRRFVSLHILVPGKWSVKRGHQLLEKIEAEIRDSLPTVTVFTHLESLEDPRSWEDQTLDR